MRVSRRFTALTELMVGGIPPTAVLETTETAPVFQSRATC